MRSIALLSACFIFACSGRRQRQQSKRDRHIPRQRHERSGVQSDANLYDVEKLEQALADKAHVHAEGSTSLHSLASLLLPDSEGATAFALGPAPVRFEAERRYRKGLFSRGARPGMFVTATAEDEQEAMGNMTFEPAVPYWNIIDEVFDYDYVSCADIFGDYLDDWPDWQRKFCQLQLMPPVAMKGAEYLPSVAAFLGAGFLTPSRRIWVKLLGGGWLARKVSKVVRDRFATLRMGAPLYSTVSSLASGVDMLTAEDLEKQDKMAQTYFVSEAYESEKIGLYIRYLDATLGASAEEVSELSRVVNPMEVSELRRLKDALGLSTMTVQAILLDKAQELSTNPSLSEIRSKFIFIAEHVLRGDRDTVCPLDLKYDLVKLMSLTEAPLSQFRDKVESEASYTANTFEKAMKSLSIDRHGNADVMSAMPAQQTSDQVGLSAVEADAIKAWNLEVEEAGKPFYYEGLNSVLSGEMTLEQLERLRVALAIPKRKVEELKLESFKDIVAANFEKNGGKLFTAEDLQAHATAKEILDLTDEEALPASMAITFPAYKAIFRDFLKDWDAGKDTSGWSKTLEDAMSNYALQWTEIMRSERRVLRNRFVDRLNEIWRWGLKGGLIREKMIDLVADATRLNQWLVDNKRIRAEDGTAIEDFDIVFNKTFANMTAYHTNQELRKSIQDSVDKLAPELLEDLELDAEEKHALEYYRIMLGVTKHYVCFRFNKEGRDFLKDAMVKVIENYDTYSEFSDQDTEIVQGFGDDLGLPEVLQKEVTNGVYLSEILDYTDNGRMIDTDEAVELRALRDFLGVGYEDGERIHDRVFAVCLSDKMEELRGDVEEFPDHKLDELDQVRRILGMSEEGAELILSSPEWKVEDRIQVYGKEFRSLPWRKKKEEDKSKRDSNPTVESTKWR